jgi:hypothetical protein
MALHHQVNMAVHVVVTDWIGFKSKAKLRTKYAYNAGGRHILQSMSYFNLNALTVAFEYRNDKEV